MVELPQYADIIVLDLTRKKLITNQAIRSTATKNMPLKNKYFVSNGRKSKPQAML